MTRPTDQGRPLARDHHPPTVWQQVVTIPAELAMVALVRRQVRRMLAGSAHRDTAALVTTELLAEAIRHTTAPVTLRLHHGASLRIEVSDQRGTHPRSPPIPADEEAPDTFALLSTLARGIGAERSHSGDHRIWARLSP